MSPKNRIGNFKMKKKSLIAFASIVTTVIITDPCWGQFQFSLSNNAQAKPCAYVNNQPQSQHGAQK